MAQAASFRLLERVLFSAGLALSLGFFLAGCGTEAKGIDSCREIEEERCRQAPACPSHFRVKSEEDVEACVRFYRDQCLHGMSAPAPGKPALDACLQTIRRAGACAKSGAASLAECSVAPSSQTEVATACELLVHPEKTAECAFLAPPAEAPPVTPPEDAGSTDAAEEAEAELPDAEVQ